jgi:hypothetical protein
MTDLQGLQTRVENARQVLDQTLSERQTMRTKIAELIAAVEQGVKEKNLELEKRNKEVESLRTENEQLQALLSNLLSTVEAKRSGAAADGLNMIFGEVARLAKNGNGGDTPAQASIEVQKTVVPAGIPPENPSQTVARESSSPFQTEAGSPVVESAASPGADSCLDLNDWDDEESSWEIESEAEFEALQDLGKKSEEIVLSIPDQESGGGAASSDRNEDEEAAPAVSPAADQSDSEEYDSEMTLDDILSRVDSIKSA